MNLQNRVDAVIRKIGSRGVTPLKIDSATALTDPAIWITDLIYIQVGKDYVVVFKNSDDGLATYNCEFSTEGIMSKLKEAANQGSSNG